MTETFAGYWWGRPDPAPARPLRPGERRPPPMDLLLPDMEMKVIGPDGEEVTPPEAGESFPTQADAESWIGETWRELREAGVASVTLMEDGTKVYGPMSLDPA